jgi:hypothetical protein
MENTMSPNHIKAFQSKYTILNSTEKIHYFAYKKCEENTEIYFSFIKRCIKNSEVM